MSLPDPSTMSDADLAAEAASYKTAPQSAQLKDPSQMTDAELHAEMGSYQKTAPNPAPTGNDQAGGNATLAAVANSPTVSKVLAVGGAMAKDIGSVASQANKLGSSLAQRLGLIDPKTKEAYDAHIDQKFAPPAVSQQAMAEHPNYARAGDIIAKSVPAAGAGALVGAGTAAMGLEKLASYSKMLGMSTAFGALDSAPGQAGSGAIGGAVGGAAFGVLGGVVSKLAQSSAPAIKVGLKNLSDKAMGYLTDPTADAQTNAVNAVVSHFQNAKAVTDKAEDMFRGVPGTFKATDLKGSLDKALEQHAAELSPSQRAVLQTASDKLAEPVTTGSLVDIKRGLNNNYQLFHDKTAMSAELGDSFQNVLHTADKQIGTTMQEAGQPDLYGKYKDIYKSTLGPLRDMKIDKWANLDPTSDAFAVKSQSFFKKMVNTNNKGEIAALRDTLGPQANKAVTSHFLSMAADSAIDAEGNLKVGSLLKTLDKLKEVGAVPEGSEEAQMMDGMRKIALTSKHASLLEHIPVVGKAQTLATSSLYHAGNLLNKLPNSAMGQAALRKIGTSANPDLVTRALETSSQLAGAAQGAYQANKITGK